MKRNYKLVLLDLWKTLVTSHCAEPVWTLQKSLGHKLWTPSDGAPEAFEPDDQFLRFCLTTPITDPDEFVREAGKRFGRPVTSRTLEEFDRIIKGEAGCVARFEDVNPTLIGLEQRGIEKGVLSNLWPFPAPQIFDANGLGKFFDPKHRYYSYELRHRKPEPEIFLAVCERAGVSPEEVLMIGDNPEADVAGAMAVGMDAALIDRPGTFSAKDIPEGAIYLRTLTDILPILD
jgi:putative hydrolase of the HAD superfamily